jgi:hypothetical protein
MSAAEKMADVRDCPSCEHVYERIIRDHLGGSLLHFDLWRALPASAGPPFHRILLLTLTCCLA